MLAERSYKTALIAAIILHLIGIIFLLAKYSSSARISLTPNASFIQATMISEHDIDNQQAAKPKQAVQQVKPQEVKSEAPAKPPVIAKPKVDLRQQLKKEQAKEMAELKKAMQAERKAVNTKKEQQIQKSLASQVEAERAEISQEAHGREVAGEYDKYKAALIQAISSQWIVPDGIDKNLSCQLLVNIAPGGEVLDVKLLSSSGNAALDRSAQAAVLKASPLPVPTDPVIFDNFRSIKITVKPEGIM